MFGITLKRREDYRKEITTQPGVETVLVFDNVKGIYPIKHEPIGKPWKCNGQYKYHAKPVAYYEDGKTREVLEPYDTLAEWREKNKDREGIHTPEDLFDAINWPEAGAVYRMGGGFMQKLNLGLFVALIGILCFFLYLVFSNLMGK